MPEAKLKIYGLTVLAEDMSIQASIDCVTWLSVAPLVHIHNVMEQDEQEKNPKHTV